MRPASAAARLAAEVLVAIKHQLRIVAEARHGLIRYSPRGLRNARCGVFRILQALSWQAAFDPSLPIALFKSSGRFSQ
jgi:hypothetical protein